MHQIIRTRNVDFKKRPSQSPSFKVYVNGIQSNDELLVNISLVDNDTKGTYYFHGKDVAALDSIHFYLDKNQTLDEIRWSGAQPYKVEVEEDRQPVIFLRTAWMKKYRGVTEEDLPSGAGSYVTENIDGGEVYNFLPVNDLYYGFARIQSARNLRLERLGAERDAPEIENVTVVLFAKNPITGGEFIVGYYKQATLNRNIVKLPKGTRGTHSFYLFKTKTKHALLIEEDKRIFELPKDGPGQTNAWYVEEYTDKKFLKETLKYISNPDDYALERKGRKVNHVAWQPDAEKRKAVELAAMEMASDYFTNLGWDVEDVHKLNKGWDMEAKQGREHLFIEIKGLSGSNLIIELSVNEYAMSKKYASQFVICIVTNALEKNNAKLFVFYYRKGQWINSTGAKLFLKERTSAILSLT